MKCRSMKIALIVLALGQVHLGGCGRSTPLEPGDLLSIRIRPENPELYINQVIQLRIEGIFLDKTDGEWGEVVRDITGEQELVFRVGDNDIIDVLEGARLAGLEAGDSRLWAFFQGREASTGVEVSYATLEGIDARPDNIQMLPGEYIQLEVLGELSNGGQIDLTDALMGTTYSSDNQAVASVTVDGLVFGHADGLTVIRVASEQYTDDVAVQVGDAPALTGIGLSPTRLVLYEGESSQLHVIGYYDDGSTSNLTNHPDTSFSISDEQVASVSQVGLVTALDEGQSEITVTHLSFEANAHVSVTGASELVSIEVEPPAAVLPLGGSIQLTVWGDYSDGSRLDVTDSASFVSSSPAVAAVSAAGRVSGDSPGSAVVTATLQEFEASCTVRVEDRRLEYLEIEPSDAGLEVGEVLQLTVTGHYDDGSQGDLTGSWTGTTYESSNPGVAMVGPEGEVIAVSEGQALIEASNSNLFINATVFVSGPSLESLSVEPSSLELGLGESAQLAVWADYSDGSRINVADQATYISSDNQVARVSAGGRVTASGSGEAIVTASFGGLSDDCQVLCGKELTDVQVQPSAVALEIGETVQLEVTAFYSDGSSSIVTGQSTFESLSQQVATVSSGGLVTGIECGLASVRASFGGLTDTCEVHVLDPIVVSLDVEPSNVQLEPGQSVELTVIATYSDDQVVNVTDQATYESSNPAVASVDSGGTVNALSTGLANIRASFGGLVDTCAVAVGEVELLFIEVNPANASLEVGETVALTVRAHYADGRVENVTAQSGFESTAPGTADVQANGLVTAYSPGNATILASFSGLEATCGVQVLTPTLLAIEVEPANLQIDVGEAAALTVRAIYSDGSSEEVTGSASFESSQPMVAVVQGSGLVTAVGPGMAVISATFQGLEDSCTVEVSGTQLEYIYVEPSSAELYVGDALQLTVMAVYSDGLESDVTALADYSSSNPSVAALSGTGLVTAQGPGQAVISVSFEGASDTCEIDVLQRVLQSIELLPASASLYVGDILQFTVIGHFSDGSSEDYTAPEYGTVYESSDNGVLGIAADGLAWANAAGGPVTVTARNGVFTDTSQVTVYAENPVPILTSVDPQQVVAGSASLILTVTGSGFVPTSRVRLEGTDLETSYLAANRLEANVPAAWLGELAVLEVSVYNPPPGGGTSGGLPLYVVDVPQVSTLSPDNGLQGSAVRVVFYGQGLLGCSVEADNPGIAVSGVSTNIAGTQLAATLTIDEDAAAGPDLVILSNLAGQTSVQFTVIEDQPLDDLFIEGPGIVYLEGVQAYHDITIGTGAVVYGIGDEPLQFLATGDVIVNGEIHVSGMAGVDGYYDPADGGTAGPGGAGGGGGGDGETEEPSSGGAGSPAGEGGGWASGAGTASGSGGGTGGGSGISGGCGQAGGGGGFGGTGGNGGGDLGPGSGGSGGQANGQGSDFNGGTGGGGGSTCGPNSGGGGGGGGGVLVLSAVTGGNIFIRGALYADGGDGGSGHVGTGGGGGGSGGRIVITSASGNIVIEDTVSTRGGDGGPAYRSDGGGGGGGGRVIIDAGDGSVDDSQGFYDVYGGAGGASLDPQPPDPGYDGLDGEAGVVDVRP